MTSPPPPWSPPSTGRRGPRLFGPTLAMVAVALGALGLYQASGGDVVDTAYPALALAVVGSMLVVGAFVGRAGGLVLLGLLAACALVVTSAVGGFRALDFGDGQRTRLAPVSATDVRSSYQLGSGRAIVDLSRVRDPQTLDGRSIEVRGGAGELVVVLPREVETDVTARVTGPGQVDLPDRMADGLGTDIGGVYGSAGAPTVTLHAQLAAGHIDVRNP